MMQISKNNNNNNNNKYKLFKINNNHKHLNVYTIYIYQLQLCLQIVMQSIVIKNIKNTINLKKIKKNKNIIFNKYIINNKCVLKHHKNIILIQHYHSKNNSKKIFQIEMNYAIKFKILKIKLVMKIDFKILQKIYNRIKNNKHKKSSSRFQKSIFNNYKNQKTFVIYNNNLSIKFK